ncbi:MAG: cupin domain-containing protein [Pseudomonadota bacterium]
MPKIDVANVPVLKGTTYPSPYDEPCLERENTLLGLASGLTQYGVNLTRLKPGVWSGQRHWHSHEDEFVYMLEGEAIMVTDAGRETLRPGDCAGFPAGESNGHHIINESDADVVFLVVGTRDMQDAVTYPDIDMLAKPGRYKNFSSAFVRKDGSKFQDDAA